jgi:hypothetical protein
MQDPSTPNPSESDKSGSESENAPKRPLKLKPIGQPKPEAETPDSKDPPKPEAKPEKPTLKPVPTEPSATKESQLDERRKNLKLRRIVVKDVEINPHINPDAEPVPEAQPYEEPDEAPPPPDLKAVMEAPPEADPPAPPISQEEPTAVEETTPSGADKIAEGSRQPDPGKPPAEKSSQPDEPEAKNISPVRKVIAGLAFLGVFCLLALLGIAYFNPFGEELAPIQPSRMPVAAQKDEPPDTGNPEESVTNVAALPTEAAQPDLQAYLDRMKTHRIIPSDNPRGIFIDSVFVPEGAVLDPRIGLTLSGVSSSGKGYAMHLTPPGGPSVSIPLNPAK